MKIHIYYRHYSVTAREIFRPEWFSYERCFRNLMNTTTDENVIINVIYDGNNIDDNWISRWKNNVNVITIKAGSDPASFFQTCKIALENEQIGDNDLIYFLENDYLHINGWVEKTLELFQTYKGLNYVSLYDHNDKYFLPQYDSLTSKIFSTNTHHWRTTPSTCGSFIVTKTFFKEDYDILSTTVGDHHKFLWLTENRNRFILTPIPGLNTHCMQGLLSPTIKWENICR